MVFDLYRPSKIVHNKEFGYVCGKECYKRAELKYAAIVLGKDERVLEKERGKGANASKETVSGDV